MQEFVAAEIKKAKDEWLSKDAPQSGYERLKRYRARKKQEMITKPLSNDNEMITKCYPKRQAVTKRNENVTRYEERNVTVKGAKSSNGAGLEQTVTKNVTKVVATRLISTWALPLEWGEWALQERPELTRDAIRSIASEFHDHWLAQPAQRGVKLDWFATWRNWVRRERRMGNKQLSVGDHNQRSLAEWKAQRREKLIDQDKS